MIRVGIVADSPVLRAGLAAVLGTEPDLQLDVSVEGLIGTQALDVLVWAPHRAISRDDMPWSDESDIDERVSMPALIVLLERMDSEVVRDAYANGASAVLAFDTRSDELVAALRAAASGLVVMQPAVSAELMSFSRGTTVHSDASSATATPLTPREREVLTLLAQGLANKMIASRLGITEHTVKTHVAAIYEKLGAGNRAEAVVAAARHGLIML